MSQRNLGFVALILIFAVVIMARYLLLSKTWKRLWQRYREALREREAFLKSFDANSFEDFSAFDFRLGRFSYVFPFPKLVNNQWRYRIYLSRSEAGDISIIVHEISECTLGRVIEKLLNLKKPLYLQRKEDNSFLVHGKKQKYLIEHVMTTFGEAEDLTTKKLFQRLDKEDVKAWLKI